MTTNRVAVLVIRAALFGLLVAVGFSRGELISVRVWLTAAAVGVTTTVLLRLIAVADVEPARLAFAWRSPLRPRRRRPGGGVQGLRSTEAMLLTASSHARGHASRLRPRLTVLADHYLPIRRGIDRGRDPEQASALLGEVAWLIDPVVNDRAPSLDEIEKFLDVILADGDTSGGRQPLDDDARAS